MNAEDFPAPANKLLLHVGLHKTGTTSIQAWLRDHRQLLYDHGWHFPNGWLHLNNHFELPLVQMRLGRNSFSRHRGDEWRSARWREDVLAQVIADIWETDTLGLRTILSCEEFSLYRFDEEAQMLRATVGDAKIVIFIRDRDDWQRDLLAELVREKPGQMLSPGRYADASPIGLSDDVEQFNHLGPTSWQLDYPERIAFWMRHFDDVEVIDFDQCCAQDGPVAAFVRELGIVPPANVDEYHLNSRGDRNDGRVPGTRWCGGRFGDELVPTLAWQTEFLRRRGFPLAARPIPQATSL